jgi:sterol desaturase/sphingolipid hydroxylase (fatty acid hydroxylase superfamily)
MHAVYEQFLILVSTPVYVFIIALEILISNYQHRKLYSWKDSLTNLYLMALNSAIDLLFRSFYIAILAYCYSHRYLEWHQAIMYWALLLLAEDFLYYWLHRFDHEIRLFWAVHVTHHSSDHLNFTVGFRSSVFQPLYRFVYFTPLAIVGFKPLDIVFMYSLTQIWGIFVHTELIRKMGVLEYFMVTPSHHRVHHASNPKYLDKNLGMFLIIWDKMFGTFQPELPDEAYEPLKYGLTKQLEKNSSTHIIFHEWKQMLTDLKRTDINLRDKMFYLFGPPGWSHDGSRQTSGELRLMEEMNRSEQALDSPSFEDDGLSPIPTSIKS